jgi:hypothetical protein
MMRGVTWLAFGAAVLAVLAGCRNWVEERDPWRHEAEVECMKSGAVREGAAVTVIQPIQGPGACGADFPLKVAALGAGQSLGFADDVRPPGAIPRVSGPPPRQDYPAYRPAPPYAQGGEPGAPMSISPPSVEPPGGEPPDTYVSAPPTYGAPPPFQSRPLPPPGAPDPQPWAPAEHVPLGSSHGPPPAAAAGYAAVTPAATLACPVVSMLDRWVAEGVQPAALKWFNQPVVEIRQISAYSCRSMNGQRGAPISEHAFGNALDVAAFTLVDGRKVTVKNGWHGQPDERGFLHDVHAAACQRFATVLAPGSNAFHYDHIHVDLARRHSGRTICNPKPVSGDLVAGRSEPFTGSIAPRRSARPPAYGTDERFDRGLPRAVAGED